MKELLLTGATGFIGRQLLNELLAQKEFALKIAIRQENEEKFAPEIRVFARMDLQQETNWHEALKNTEVVIHAAARAHIMNDKAQDPLFEFRKVNTEGTLKLARQAAQLGVKRFIYISSIAVNGKKTDSLQAFFADDLPNPRDPYAISKYEAEQGLQAISAETGMEIVIIRPPLVYGPGVKGNFLRMLYWLQKGIPLPFGAVKNKRSLVAVENLNSLIITCLTHPRAANQIFLVSDDEDVSTTELLNRISHLINKPARLIPIPPIMLRWAAILLGQKAVYERLCGSLQLNISKTKEELDWNPKVTMDKALHTIFDSVE